MISREEFQLLYDQGPDTVFGFVAAMQEQIAILTARITDLSKHMTTNKKDFASRLGLLKIVGERRRLLNYLSRVDVKQYQKVLTELNLRK